MDSSQFDFTLPSDLIAQTPAAQRDESRLLVYDRSTGKIEHALFRDIGDFLPSSSLMVRNNATVLPARLFGQRPTGGQVECLLLRPGSEPLTFHALTRPARKLPPGSTFALSGEFSAEVLADGAAGEKLLRFHLEKDDSVTALARRIGKMPLPPYISREKADDRDNLDRERYQTVFADPQKTVAAAAPTAGLHFTPKLLRQLEDQGHEFTEVTLHVGEGTFRPIVSERLEEHEMHREWYEIPAQTRSDLRRAKEQGQPVVAIGTTAVRSLEDYARAGGHTVEFGTADFASEAGLFLYPPTPFHLTDALITNFHLPRSTLLCLLAAILDPGDTKGLLRWREIYELAIAKRYRFFSYGDAMLIV
ncbi:MAG: tRNA preQ1(34) S-adenosylmethionine ribosyltransferase-isomerase QueA [Opitutales bacterium]|nr:tRNA preQ1(34) S-adenosylmethionine ribosyltransferase-isomerase QueA [Opitutales bacterium]MCH8541861.1 tRNA preQ1(34) S-adenosylmethionine ribosyltransferase-isomerase QueA [Opitutales bacterium]